MNTQASAGRQQALLHVCYSPAQPPEERYPPHNQNQHTGSGHLGQAPQPFQRENSECLGAILQGSNESFCRTLNFRRLPWWCRLDLGLWKSAEHSPGRLCIAGFCQCTPLGFCYTDQNLRDGPFEPRTGMPAVDSRPVKQHKPTALKCQSKEGPAIPNKLNPEHVHKRSDQEDKF